MNEIQPQAVAKPKRRWFQYSLRTLLLLPVLLGLVLSAIYSWPYVQRRYILWRLQAYADRDLRKLPEGEKQQVDRWITTLTHKKDDLIRPFWGREYWLLNTARGNGDGGGQMYVVEMQPTHTIPGSSYCCLHRLDLHGRRISSTELDLGNRSLPVATTLDVSEHGFL